MKTITELARECGMSIHTDDHPYMDMIERFARAIERAHGINVPQARGEQE